MCACVCVCVCVEGPYRENKGAVDEENEKWPRGRSLFLSLSLAPLPTARFSLHLQQNIKKNIYMRGNTAAERECVCVCDTERERERERERKERGRKRKRNARGRFRLSLKKESKSPSLFLTLSLSLFVQLGTLGWSLVVTALCLRLTAKRI